MGDTLEFSFRLAITPGIVIMPVAATWEKDSFSFCNVRAGRRNMQRNTWIELNLDTLGANIAALRQALAQKTEPIFVVKANAYGHGMEPVARHAAECGIKWFAVAHTNDALNLRAVLPHARILLTSATLPEDAKACADAGLTALVVDVDQARGLAARAAKTGKRLTVHAKVDTGMGRLGLAWETAAAHLSTIARESALSLEGVCTHFASSDNPDPTFLNQQAGRFRGVLEECHRGGLHIPMRHASNSGAILADPSLDFDAVRPGILLYGYPPSRLNARPIAVRPVLQWKTRVLQVKEVPSDTPVSYDSTYRTSHATCLATLDVGYADGYTRRFTNKGSVLIGGRRRKIAGRVTMNLIVVDLGLDHTVKPGDEAVLLGQQGEESIWADELASLSGTISYEILTSIRVDNDSV